MRDLSNWKGVEPPSLEAMGGRHVQLEPMVDERHLADLYAAYSSAGGYSIWDYLPYGPFKTFEDFEIFARDTYFNGDPLFHAVVDVEDGKAKGVASLMRIDTANGVIEVGHICYSPALQRSRATTEAMYLFGCRVFDELGNRRFEWKCNNENEASKAAAQRYGFVPESVFRQAAVVKGKNRDTAWFSILDIEWPALKKSFEAWLDDANFDEAGEQIQSLATMRDAV